MSGGLANNDAHRHRHIRHPNVIRLERDICMGAHTHEYMVQVAGMDRGVFFDVGLSLTARQSGIVVRRLHATECPDT